MINVSGHLRNKRRIIGFEDHSVPLLVNCCGMQIFKTKDYSQARTEGRVDYQLIYIYKGAGHYHRNQAWHTVGAGNVLLFRPGEPQVYSYYASEHPEIYWIHFTGNDCESLLEQYQIDDCYIGEQAIMKHLFEHIISELQSKKAFFSDIVLHDFQEILILIARLRQQITPPPSSRKPQLY